MLGKSDPYGHDEKFNALGHGASKYGITLEARKLSDRREGLCPQVFDIGIREAGFGQPAPLARDHRRAPFFASFPAKDKIGHRVGRASNIKNNGFHGSTS
jgi:hypothetical protein